MKKFQGKPTVYLQNMGLFHGTPEGEEYSSAKTGPCQNKVETCT